MLLRSLVLYDAVAALPSGIGPEPSLDLSSYRLERTFVLPAAASQPAAIAYNRDRGTLVVLDGECDGLMELTRTGAMVSAMRLHGFEDIAGITYVGDSRFVLSERRLRSAYLLQYAAGGSAARPSLPAISLDAKAAEVQRVEVAPNEPPQASLATDDDTTVRAVHLAGLDFGAGTAAVAELFATAPRILQAQPVPARSSSFVVPDGDDATANHDPVRRATAGAHPILGAFDFSTGSDSTDAGALDGSAAIDLATRFPPLRVPPSMAEPASIVLMAPEPRLLVCRRHTPARQRVSSRRHESFTKCSRSRPSIG